MKNKKSQVNKVFVYLLSIILILFVGFLVVKFVTTFGGIVNSQADSKIYSKLEKDYSKVYTSYGSEEIFKYRVSSNVELICFVNKINNCEIVKTNISTSAYENLNISINSNENIALFDKDDILNSKSIGNFNIVNDCLCIKPKNGLFSIILENRKNKVWISENK